ncbi:MAG: HAMP domain-containing protein [Phycisphaerae bacterium]|nr:HAMP domain-containing protein [Phycisphaerae bacterium]
MRLSIRSRLILSVGVPLLVIYGGVIGMDAYRSRKATEEQIRVRLRNQARTTAGRLEYALRGVVQTANRLSDDVATNENVPREFYWLILQRALERNRGISSACVAFEPMTGPGEVYSFAPLVERKDLPRKERELFRRYGLDSEPDRPIRSEHTDYFDANWYRQAVLGEKGVWSEPYYDNRGRLVCTFAEPIYRDGALLGVTAVNADVERLRRIVERHRAPGETVLLVSRNGRFLHHPRKPFMMAQSLEASDETVPWASLARAMASGGEETLRLQTPQGAVRAFFTPVPSAGWSCAVILPEEAMLQPLQRYLRGEAAVLLVALGLVLLIVLVMSLSLTRRLARLSRTIRKVEAGNVHAKVPGRLGRDEIGDAARAFNRLTDRLADKQRDANPK